MNSITVRHNIEVAHRLSQTPGKCQAIHGHSMWVELTLIGKVDSSGKVEGLDFSNVKALFRGYLDKNFDHHLLLNKDDSLLNFEYVAGVSGTPDEMGHNRYPGLQTLDGDPTTENLASNVCRWAMDTFKLSCHVRIHETSVNSATATAVSQNASICLT